MKNKPWKHLRYKIFFSVTFLILVPIIIYIWLFGVNLVENLANKQISTLKENVIYLSKLTNDEFRKIKSVSLLLYNDDEIMLMLDGGLKNDPFKTKSLENKMVSIFHSDKNINAISLYLLEEQLLLYQERNHSRRFYKVMDNDELMEYFIIDYPVESLTYKITSDYNKDEKAQNIVLSQIMMDRNYKPLARLEIVYSQSTFYPIFSNELSKKDETILILDQSKQVLYADQLEHETLDRFVSVISKEREEESPSHGMFRATMDDEEYFFIYSDLEDFDYSVYKVFPTSIVYGSVYPFTSNLIIMTICLLAALFVLAFLLAKYISTPISVFIEKIKEFRANESNGVIEAEPRGESGIYEIEELRHEFDLMIQEIHELIDQRIDAKVKQKEAQLRLLIVQVNPHFLYNTLQTMQHMALKRNAYEINSMLTSLSNILRYSLKWENSTARIKEEIQHASEYLVIQKYRYLDDLEFYIDIDPELPEIIVPKMMIQPIVENAFVHGFKGKNGPYKIWLTVKKTDDEIIITAKDNGKGMEEDKLIELNKSMEQTDIAIPDEHSGLLSVNARLKSLNPASGIYLMQEDGLFEVVVKIPMRYENESIDY